MKNMDNKPPLMPTETKSRDGLALERLIFFSDAVFAIAITLLALDIRLPPSPNKLDNAGLAQALFNLWPKYLGFAISYLVIGLLWFGHHRKFQSIRRTDNALIFLNLLLLMVVVFIPYPASVVSENGNRTATIFYAVVMAAAGLLSALMWIYAAHRDLADPALDDRQRRRETLIPLAMAGFFLLSIGIAFIDADLAKTSWLLIALSVFILR